jgi:hypothetical protein
MAHKERAERELFRMDTEDIKNLELVREFITYFRNSNYSQYSKNDRLKYQAFSNCIGLLHDRIEELVAEKV